MLDWPSVRCFNQNLSFVQLKFKRVQVLGRTKIALLSQMMFLINYVGTPGVQSAS